MDFICKSPESVLKSLSDWFDCSLSDIKTILSKDWISEYESVVEQRDKHYYEYGFDEDDDKIYEDFGIYLLYKGFGDYPISHKSVNIHWFHGSRVIDTNSFKIGGILPLTNMLPKIKELIDSIAQRLGIPICEDTESSWTKQRIEIKLNSAIDHGPCAMLMYEASINANAFSCHSYIDEPEIVSDYAIAKYGEAGNEIIAEFKRISKPVVVEFIEVKDCKDPTAMDEILRAALTYMYDFIHNEEIGLNDNTCYSGCGRSVSKDRIIDVIVL